MKSSSRISGRPARLALAAAVVGAGAYLAATSSAATAACTAPATDLASGGCRATFTSSGTFAVPAGVTSADVLVVGGGGAGALSSGGGGGEVVVKSGFAVTPSASVAVTVGMGGQAEGDPVGGQSSFGSLTASGGQGGLPATGGGSGTFTGGAAVAPNGGGGAGASGNGLPATASPLACGVGGPGVDVSGTFAGLSPSVFGGGGGGAFILPGTVCTGGTGGGGSGASAMGSPQFTAATSGLANAGGGGGGGYGAGGPGSYTTGGSGLVVVQYTPVTTIPTVSATVLVPRKVLVTGQSTKLAIRAINTGSTTATAVTACLSAPANLVITKLNGGTRSKGTVCFAVGDLAAGASATRSVTVRGVALRRVTRTVGGSVTATGITAAIPADPVIVSIRPRTVRKVVVTG